MKSILLNLILWDQENLIEEGCKGKENISLERNGAKRVEQVLLYIF